MTVLTIFCHTYTEVPVEADQADYAGYKHAQKESGIMYNFVVAALLFCSCQHMTQNTKQKCTTAVARTSHYLQASLLRATEVE